MTTKKRLKPASNKAHTKIIQEKLYHRNEVLWMNRSEADALDQFLTEPSEELQKIEPEWEYDEEEDSRGNTLWT